ncbi:uncharacterized protein LOC119682223 [Teleopsis dalmanni]|nr:uncharacterized protein LOC119682223 [Teleopsis dalmanni]
MEDCKLIPTWLTNAYFQNVLRNYKKDTSLTVTKMESSVATGKGENFISVIIRVIVEYKSNNKASKSEPFIVKSKLEHDVAVTLILEPYQAEATEMLMYDKILPILNELIKLIDEQEKLFPTAIFVDYEHRAIIFEDLAELGYTSAARLNGIDEEVAKLCLENMAKIHATGLVFNTMHPGLLQQLHHGVFNRHTRGFAAYFETIMEVCANFAGDCVDLGIYYKEKLLKLKDNMMECGARVFDVKPDFFNTLCHGDFWANNLMVTYTEEANISKIKNVLALDFQFSVWGSPAVDLHLFFNTSLRHELRLHKQKILVEYYYGILTRTLQKLNYTGDVPTLKDLWVQLEAKRFYAVTASLIVQPVLLNENNEDADFNALVSDDERGRRLRSILYTNKKVQEYAKILIPFFDQKGLLDGIV